MTWDDKIHEADGAYREASMRWGGEAQMAKAAEELNELAAECCRDLNGQADPGDFLKEVVDARLMIEQLAEHITDEALEEMVAERLDHLESRLAGASP